MLTAAQLQERLSGVGASEVGAILGVGEEYFDGKKTRQRTAEEVLAVKTGQAPDFEGNNYTDWGNRLEPVIAEWYTEVYGGTALRSDTVWSISVPFAFCTPDRLIFRDNAKHGLEIKNKSYSQRSKWKDGPTPAVEAQARWSMMVMELPRWDVAALFGGNDPKCWTLHRDRKWEKEAIKTVAAFWQRVEQANQELWGAP